MSIFSIASWGVVIQHKEQILRHTQTLSQHLPDIMSKGDQKVTGIQLDFITQVDHFVCASKNFVELSLWMLRGMT